MSKTLLRAAVAVSLLGVAATPVAAEVAAPQAPVRSPHQRVLPLQGGQNFRELGGYRTSDGRTVRWGLLYRSGSMHFLTTADYAYLSRLGIRTVCDFRDTRERAVGPAEWPSAGAPHVLADDYKLDLSSLHLSTNGAPPTPEQARAGMIALYPQLLTTFNGQYRRMFGELLAGRAPLAFNCTAGKDRTGVAAALLLTALGVPRRTVIDDYLLSNLYYDPNKTVLKDQTAKKLLPPAGSTKGADPSYIGAVFAVMDAHKGGAEGYLRDELGLSHADIVQLRRMYTH